MIQKVNVTKISGRNTKKDGSALVNKFGKAYFIIGLQCTQHGQAWINGFADSIPQWKGKEVELDIYEEEYNGTKSLKFKVPKAEEKNTNEIKSMLLDIQLRLGSFGAKIDFIYKALAKNRTSDGGQMPSFEHVKLPPEVLKRAELVGNSAALGPESPIDESLGASVVGNDPTLSPEDEEAMNAAFDALPM